MLNEQMRACLSPESGLLRELKLTCMNNLLSAPDAIVFFKDLDSRFLVVSEGWIANVVPGLTAEEIIGKTDFNFFSREFAAATLEDEQRVICTGEPLIAKLELETFNDRADAWFSSTKMPLRDESGRVIGTFGISRNVTALIEAEKALAYQALHDPVTGLANRTAFMDRLSQSLLELERRPSALAVLFVDLDHFKQINDSFGHDAGDQVLTEVGRRLLVLARGVDTVCATSAATSSYCCARTLALTMTSGSSPTGSSAAPRPYAQYGHDIFVTGSVGIVVTRDPLAEPENLVRDADAAMYEAKKIGRDCYRVSSTRPTHASTSNLLA